MFHRGSGLVMGLQAEMLSDYLGGGLHIGVTMRGERTETAAAELRASNLQEDLHSGAGAQLRPSGRMVSVSSGLCLVHLCLSWNPGDCMTLGCSGRSLREPLARVLGLPGFREPWPPATSSHLEAIRTP